VEFSPRRLRAFYDHPSSAINSENLLQRRPMTSLFMIYCRCLVLFIGFSLASQSDLTASEIKILSWNVESNRGNSQTSDPEVIASQLNELQQTRGPYDLIGLTEVAESSRQIYRDAITVNGITYVDFMSESGLSDRTMMLIRKDRFKIQANNATELTRTDATPEGEILFPGNGSRRPLFVRVNDTHNNNVEFCFMVNHLERGNEKTRTLQARGLREWARRQTIPIIAVGDYNFDFDFAQLTGNPAMAIFMRRDGDREGRGYFVWKWIVPDRVVEVQGTNDANRQLKSTILFSDTNWDGRQGVDVFRDSILDFIFLAQGARDWKAESHVIIRADDFPDNSSTSDHRPIEGILDPELPALNIGGPLDR
jgi:endonuclease/exonuclease/phosphatase family metal-dependent hydrolase